MAGPVSVRDEGPLRILTIDHPPLNLFDEAMFGALGEALERCEADSPRALLIRAEGGVVSGGVDVHEFDGLAALDAAELWRRLIGTVRLVEAMPCPTVFAAHALCLTAAFEVSLGCDLLVAAESARFGLVERVVGLTPSMGGTQRIAERAGPARARELVMTGRLYSASELEAWNVVNRVWPDDRFEEKAMELAEDLAHGPTRAHLVTREIVRVASREGVDAADEATPALSSTLFETEDLKGAVKSFLEDGPGKATFEGR
ncbi:MAG: enoyl-CoA hydratase/isomerase family protein [Solirubrobacterales bacterium]